MSTGDLLHRINVYLRQLAPHMTGRDGVVLLREARDEIEMLRSAYNPEGEDGHDCEGFVGGCERFGCPGGENCTLNETKGK